LAWGFKNDTSYVSQNTYLFPGTIKENILFGDISKINEMNKMSDTCLKFVKDLENGFETIIEDQSLNLSGGQKQRIGIARALVKDACVLVMDEPTAFLDKENEEIITELIEEHTKEKTLLLITHNLRVASKLDHIVVMDKGRIVEQGDHESLVKKCGLYCKLYSQNTAC
jgi:ABC-type multidrug transport system fused ATPase/permease subunit